MQSQTVEKLPPCTECVAEARNEPNDAEYRVKTPMKTTANLCFNHFMDYVEARLGTQTVARFALVARAGGSKTKAA